MISRIVKLRDHHNVMVGQDLANILEDGMIYGIQELMGVITLIPIGPSAHTIVAYKRYPSFKSDPRTKGQILMDGTTYITEEEYKKEKKHYESEY